MSKKYICVAPEKEVFNVNGKSLGTDSKRALYYSEKIGKNRIYRNSYPDTEPFFWGLDNVNADLILLRYETKEEAQEVCDEINKAYGDNFQVELEGVDNER